MKIKITPPSDVNYKSWFVNILKRPQSIMCINLRGQYNLQSNARKNEHFFLIYLRLISVNLRKPSIGFSYTKKLFIEIFARKYLFCVSNFFLQIPLLNLEACYRIDINLI